MKRLTALASLLLFIVAPALADVTLRDGDFVQFNASRPSPDGWLTVGPQVSRPAEDPTTDVSAVSLMTFPDGGNPGAYGQVTHTLRTISTDQGVSSWIGLIHTGLSFSPGDFDRTDLQIEDILFSLQVDARVVGRGARTVTLGLQQTLNGVDHLWFEFEERLFLRENSWTTVNLTDISLDQLEPVFHADTPPPDLPDFSPGAPEIRVGLVMGLSCPANSDCSNPLPLMTDFDNFMLLVRDKEQFRITPGLNDAWYSPEYDGDGFFVNVYPGQPWPDGLDGTGTVFVSWFTYEVERSDAEPDAIIGEPRHRWLTAQGPYFGRVADLQLFVTSGGEFDREIPVPQTETKPPFGTLSMTFSGCNSASVEFDIPGVASRRRDVVRVLADPATIQDCEDLQSLPLGQPRPLAAANEEVPR